MQGKATLLIILFSLVLVLVACANQASISTPSKVPATGATQQVAGGSTASTAPTAATVTQVSRPSGIIKAREIIPAVAEDVVSIPVSTVQNVWNTHFETATPNGKWDLWPTFWITIFMCAPAFAPRAGVGPTHWTGTSWFVICAPPLSTLKPEWELPELA